MAMPGLASSLLISPAMRTAKTTLIGPSLIEVLVCVAILGLLLGIVLH